MDKPQRRKNIRLKNYDYSQSGYYFITICTHNKSNIFGTIVGAIQESPETARMLLNDNGLIIKSVVEKLSERFPDISIDNYVIMPNHIHMIVIVSDKPSSHESPPSKRSLLSQVIGFFKMNTTKQIRVANGNIDVWQRNYHDHIIRDDNEYPKIYEYIETNPVKWELDMYYGEEK